MHRFAALVTWLAFLLSTLTVASQVTAGDGKISNGKLDLLVYFAYDERDHDSWKPVFKEFSKLLFNATERQLQLGTVTFTNCRQLRDRADVWVLNDNSGARAHLNGLGKPGRHMTVSQTHKSISGAALGHFGMTHEAGHYLFGILDEYKGYVGNVKSKDPKHFCVTDASGTCCIMDGGTTIAGNNGRTEFCTTGFASTKHNKGENNAAGRAIKNNQEYFLGKSCWATIKESGNGLTEPSAEPTDSVAGLGTITFKTVDGQLALVMVIDRSGSMSGTRIALAKQGAKLGVGVMADGEDLGVVSFSNTTSVNMSIRKLDAAARVAANNAINGLQASGLTAIGSGLLTGQGQLDTVDGCAEIIVLLSDGSSNSGPSPISVIPTLKNKGTVVFSIGLGTGVNVSTLTAIATGTGGKYFSAPSAASLPAIFQKILLEVQGGITLGENSQRSLAGGASEELKTPVSAFADELIISMGHVSGTMALTLKNPAGQEINLVNWANFNGVNYRSTTTQKVFTVRGPAVGEWTAAVQNTGSSATTYDLIVANFAGRISLAAEFGDNTVRYPQPIPVTVAVSAGWQVTGASVMATVKGPRGNVLPTKLELFDDGQSVHGDEFPGDGLYSALFAGYTAGNGSYTFDVEVVNTTGTASTFTECPPCYTGLEEGAKPIPVPPFSGSVFGSQSVSGVPSTITTGSLTLSDTNPSLNGQTVNGEAPSTTVVLDIALQASASESVVLKTIEIDKSQSAGLADLGELELHIDRPDANGQTDGKIDVPSVPIATAIFTANKLVITSTSGFAIIPAGRSLRLLVTVGDARVEAAGLVPPIGGNRLPYLPLLASVALLALLWFSLSRLARVRAARTRAGVATASSALLLVVFCAIPACKGSSSGGGAPPVTSLQGTMTLSVPTSNIKASGATTGKDVTITGSDIQVTTTFN